jgi:hypothetical protein
MRARRKTFASTAIARTARLLCSIAAAALPAETRTRFLDEWRADLAAEPDRALAYAASLVRNAVALRRAVGGERDAPVAVPCRLHLHSNVRVHDNPDDPSIVTWVCARCGRIKDEWIPQASAVSDGLAWGASQGIH